MSEGEKSFIPRNETFVNEEILKKEIAELFVIAKTHHMLAQLSHSRETFEKEKLGIFTREELDSVPAFHLISSSSESSATRSAQPAKQNEINIIIKEFVAEQKAFILKKSSTNRG